MSRPWLIIVWERSFVTEDEADEAYEQFMEWIKPPLEVDRLDGHSIRLYLDTRATESRCQLVEVQFEPTTIVTYCGACGHIAAAHKGEEALCTASNCRCDGFQRGPAASS